MKTAYLLIGCWIALSASSSGAWQGIKKRLSEPVHPPASEAPRIRPPDTAFLSRKVTAIPSGTAGKYMGTLEGVRCFNCAPDQVHLNLGDSLSREAAVIALRIEVWNAIERPLRDRRMFDHGNRCFYFGHKSIDTVFVGGDWTEIRVKDVPCYPYLRRTLRTSLAAQRMNPAVPFGAPVAATAGPADPAEAPGEGPAGVSAPPPPPVPEDIYFP